MWDEVEARAKAYFRRLYALDVALANYQAAMKNCHAAVQLTQRAIIDALHARGYTDTQIAELARRRPRQRRRRREDVQIDIFTFLTGTPTTSA